MNLNPRVLCVFPLLIVTAANGAVLSDAELDAVGRRVWQNECRGSRDGLTSWNSGENFASLGIGHFIWYPQGIEGPFEESFPKLVAFLGKHEVKLPEWLKPSTDCPWNTQAAFQAAFRSQKMNELRDLLASTIRLQSRFLVRRMEEALPKLLAEAPPSDRVRVRENFERLAATGTGTFALIDYVNFKGEGTNPAERYKGEGWGLLQVLNEMRSDTNPVTDFARSAAIILERRMRNSPPERSEARWRAGWKARVQRYAAEK
jgi:hypothetical protein